MKNKNLKRMSIALAAVMVIGMTGCGAKKDVEEPTTKVESEVATNSEELTEENVKDTYTGIEDVYVLKDSKDVDYLNGVLYDSSIVKDIQVDSSQVDSSKEGTYKITYEVTVDREALDDYRATKVAGEAATKATTNKAPASTEENTSDKPTEATSTTETVKKSDGTEVKTEEKAPASTEENTSDKPTEATSTTETVKKTDGTEVKTEEKAPASTDGNKSDKSTEATSTTEKSDGTEVKTEEKVVIEKETTVVDKDKAQDLADKDTVVKADKDETVKKSDGTEVKTEEKAPASTTVTNGTVINASNKEEVKPEATAKPTEEPKKEETKKEESKPAASTENKEDTKTPTTNNSSNKNDNNSSNNTSKPSSSSNNTSSNNTSKPSSSSNNNSSNNNSSNNNSSNNNQPSKPAHTHTWVDVTKTVNHPAVTHEEPVYEPKQVLVTPAWDERVYVKSVNICRQCGFETSDGSAMNDHLFDTGHSCTFKDIYETVHHDAVYNEEQVQVGTTIKVDTPAWTETVVTGQKCSGCGATK